MEIFQRPVVAKYKQWHNQKNNQKNKENTREEKMKEINTTLKLLPNKGGSSYALYPFPELQLSSLSVSLSLPFISRSHTKP